MSLFDELIDVLELLVDVFELLWQFEFAFIQLEKVDELKKFVRLVELG
jgi:hypothetical protein